MKYINGLNFKKNERTGPPTNSLSYKLIYIRPAFHLFYFHNVVVFYSPIQLGLTSRNIDEASTLRRADDDNANASNFSAKAKETGY